LQQRFNHRGTGRLAFCTNPAKTYNVVENANVRFTRVREASQLTPFQMEDL